MADDKTRPATPAGAESTATAPKPSEETVEVVTNHYVYHTPGRPPHPIGALVRMLKDEALHLLRRGHVRLPNDEPMPASVFQPAQTDTIIGAPPPLAPGLDAAQIAGNPIGPGPIRPAATPPAPLPVGDK